MPDYSEEWREYLEIEGEVSESLERLGRFYTHISRIPVQEQLSREERNTGKYGEIEMVLEGYNLEGSERYRNFLEEVKEDEELSSIEAVDLYIQLAAEIEEIKRVDSAIKNIESAGASPTAIRELSELTKEAIESKLQESMKDAPQGLVQD